jgi:putative restriction endonuclease
VALLDEHAVRVAAMAWLDERTAGGDIPVRQPDVAGFPFLGEQISLLMRQQGICKPRQLEAALAIRTTWTADGATPPYQDREGPDGLLRYAYRGSDPQSFDNVALRRAYELRLPLIWFIAVAPGVFRALYPVFVVADEPEQLRVALAVDEGQRFLTPETVLADDDRRRYVQRMNRLRLHQPIFRARVLAAYEGRCTICRLGHRELLDAAHILADGHPRGTPVVPNGLAMCAIHHRAFDANVLGIRPDHVVEIRRDILDEIDGPMLRHGLQEMAGTTITRPGRALLAPDPSRLEERYEQFRAAG